jgi:hypothetical protein
MLNSNSTRPALASLKLLRFLLGSHERTHTSRARLAGSEHKNEETTQEDTQGAKSEDCLPSTNTESFFDRGLVTKSRSGLSSDAGVPVPSRGPSFVISQAHLHAPCRLHVLDPPRVRQGGGGRSGSRPMTVDATMKAIDVPKSATSMTRRDGCIGSGQVGMAM